MSLPSSPTKDRGQLPQVLRPLLPAPSTGEDQPIAPTSSLLQGAEQLPLVEQPSLTEQPRRTEPQSVLSIPSALSQEEQSQISFDFDPLPAGIDLNFDRPYRPYSNTTPSTPAPTPAPIPEPQPVDPALSSTEFQLTSQPRSLTADHYFFKEPCPFTGIIRGAPTPAPAVTEAQTSSTPLSIDNTPDQPENPLQPPAPFSYGYTYPPPPVPGAPLLPFPPQDRKRKDAGSTGSKHSRKKRRTSEYPPPFKAPDTPRPRTPALPFGVPQSRSEGFLLPPTFDNRKRLASELEDYTVTCPAGKKICLEQPNEQPYEQQYEHPYNKPTQDPLAPVDIPEFVLLESLKRAGQHNSFILSLVVGNYREAKNRSELNSCDYQNTPVYQQPTEQQAPVDQTSTNQASFEQASVEQASKKKDSNKKAAKKGSAETMSSNETPVEAPAQSFAMPAMNPAGYQVQDPSYEGRPYINMNPALDALGEFTDPDVYRKLKFGGMIIERANLAPSKSLPYPEQYKRLKNIQEELARQDSIAPILPPSELSPQDPKGFTPKPYNVPEDIEDRRVHDFFAQKNKDLCTRNKQVDLDRNNMAAKGTRQRREESLSQYRTIARDLAIERNWWRLKAASLGGDPTEFDAFTDHTRRAMSFEMDERMEKLEKEAAKKAKRVKAKAQAAITSQNNKLAKQDVQRQNKEIKQVVSAFAAGDLAAIERMSQADYDAKATAYRKPRTKQPSKRARKANNVDDDKDSNAEIETSEVETPANNATEEAAGDPGNSENIDSNMYGLDDLARANTELTTSDTNVASQSVYPSIEDAQPSNDFTFNPVPNFDSNVQAQDNEPSGAEELDDTEHNDLRRMPSNVTMFDAPTDGTHITTSMAPPGLMPTMMDQSAWAPPPTFDSSTLPPTQFNPQLNGPMGDMIMPSGDMHAPVNDMSMVPVNNMDFNFHNPMNDIGPMAPSYMTSDFQGTMNGIDAPSSQNLRQPWFRPTSNAESNALGPALPVMSQSIELPQQTATTNNTGTSDTFDRNADPSTFPDPHDEIFFGNYLGDMNSSQN